MPIILSFVAASILVVFLFVVNLGLSHSWKMIIGIIAFVISSLTYYGVFYLEPWLIVCVDVILLALISYIVTRRYGVRIFPINMRKLVTEVKEKETLKLDDPYNNDFVEPLPLDDQLQDELQSFSNLDRNDLAIENNQKQSTNIDLVQEEIGQIDLDQFILNDEKSEKLVYSSQEMEEKIISPLEDLLSDSNDKEINPIQFSEIEPLSFEDEDKESVKK